MDEKAERRRRRTAIRLRLRGWATGTILKRVGRSRQWLAKWVRRFKLRGPAGLRSRSRRPRRMPAAYPAWVRRWVVRIRRQLMKRRVGLIGAPAIQQELRKPRLLPAIPSLTTIKRIVRRAGLTRPAPAARPAYYPAVRLPARYVRYALDWTERYLAGGPKVYAFHTLDLATRACKQTISPNKAGPTVRTHALDAWKGLGIPDVLQVDNDAAFNGGYKVKRVMGQFVRLCLSLGIEVLFLPVGEAERNGDIESLNRLWNRAFYKRRRFRSVAQVQRSSPEFEAWYMHEYQPPSLPGQHPAQAQRAVARRRLSAAECRALPEPLPITAGRIHFIRQVQPDGTIRLLNESWRVGRRLAGQYVWATITTHRHTLRIYHRRSARKPVRLVRQYAYALAEPVAPLQPPFKRPYPRPRVSTML